MKFDFFCNIIDILALILNVIDVCMLVDNITVVYLVSQGDNEVLRALDGNVWYVLTLGGNLSLPGTARPLVDTLGTNELYGH